jgi:hypothetical protein
MVRSLRVGVATLAMVTWAWGCALIVGDPAGNVQAGSDAGMRPDAPNRHDGNTQGRMGEDATTDVSPPPDASVDVLLDVGRVREPGFCATYVPPAAAFSICDDFDEPGDDATALGGVTVYGSVASVTTKGGHFKSSPHSLYVVSEPAAGPTTSAGAYVTRPLAPGTIITVDCDFLLENVPDLSNSEFVELDFSQGGDVAEVVVNLAGDMAGNLTAVQVYELDPADAGTRYHTAVPLSFGGWGHLTLTVQRVPGGAILDSLAINGVLRESNVALAPGFILGNPAVRIGWSYAEGYGNRAAYIDNVVVVTQ